MACGHYANGRGGGGGDAAHETGISLLDITNKSSKLHLQSTLDTH